VCVPDVIRGTPVWRQNNKKIKEDNGEDSDTPGDLIKGGQGEEAFRRSWVRPP